jgi:hypothetical protein
VKAARFTNRSYPALTHGVEIRPPQGQAQAAGYGSGVSPLRDRESNIIGAVEIFSDNSERSTHLN